MSKIENNKIYLRRNRTDTLQISNLGNIAESTIVLSVKKWLQDTDYIIQKSGIIIDAINGIVEIQFTSDDTNIEAGTYHCDIKIIYSESDGNIKDIFPTNPKEDGYLIITNSVG